MTRWWPSAEASGQFISYLPLQQAGPRLLRWQLASVSDFWLCVPIEGAQSLGNLFPFAMSGASGRTQGVCGKSPPSLTSSCLWVRTVAPAWWAGPSSWGAWHI